MCRLLGIVASELTEFGLGLTRAPRSLATLSRHHPDGWGIATHDADHAGDPAIEPWAVHKGTVPAADDHRFHDVATKSRGHVLVAHVRQKTVGPTRLENTHPFVRDGWVFAHNGTIKETAVVRAGCSARRLAEIAGDTDSELFFAYVLTRLDERRLIKLHDEPSRARATEVLHELTAELRGAQVGAINFLLSDGSSTFAHRFGRSLFVLERGPTDPVRKKRDDGQGATIMTKWTARRRAVMIASEHFTDEPWAEVPDGTLLRVERTPEPRIVTGEDEGERVAS